jgi:tyrosine-protein kinase Etk/Wzc
LDHTHIAADNKLTDSKPLNLVDYLLILLRWKKFIIIASSVVTILAIVLYFFVFDLIYYSSATVKSSSKSPSFLTGIDGLGDLGGIGDLVGGSSSLKELSFYMEVLSSRRCLEPLIKKFGLMERDEIDFMEDAVKQFRKEKLILDIDKPSGLLYIGVLDKDPILAKEMVIFLIGELNKINIDLSVLNAKNNREFIEKRYLLAKTDLANAEDSLRSFQLIYGVAPDLQIKASAQSVLTLEAELKGEEIKLDVLKKILSADQPEVKIQETKVSSIRSKIEEVRTSTDVNDFLSLGNSPNIALRYLRLQRDIEIQTKILTFMLPIYEQAKIEERKEMPAILVLDEPYLAEKKTKPKRLTMVLLSLLGSLVVFSVGVIVYESSVKKILKNLKDKK